MSCNYRNIANRSSRVSYKPYSADIQAFPPCCTWLGPITQPGAWQKRGIAWRCHGVAHETGRTGQVGHRTKITPDINQEKKLSLVPTSKGADTMKKMNNKQTTQTPFIISCKTDEKAAWYFWGWSAERSLVLREDIQGQSYILGTSRLHRGYFACRAG